MNFSLCHALHEALYVHIEEDMRVLFVWKGGTYINLYDFEGRAIDAFSRDFGDRNIPTLEEAKEMIQDHLSEG